MWKSFLPLRFYKHLYISSEMLKYICSFYTYIILETNKVVYSNVLCLTNTYSAYTMGRTRIEEDKVFWVELVNRSYQLQTSSPTNLVLLNVLFKKQKFIIQQYI